MKLTVTVNTMQALNLSARQALNTRVICEALARQVEREIADHKRAAIAAVEKMFSRFVVRTMENPQAPDVVSITIETPDQDDQLFTTPAKP